MYKEVIRHEFGEVLVLLKYLCILTHEFLKAPMTSEYDKGVAQQILPPLLHGRGYGAQLTNIC